MGNGIYYINHYDEKKYMRKYGASKTSFKIFTICVVIILCSILFYMIKWCRDFPINLALIGAMMLLIPFFLFSGIFYIVWNCGPKQFYTRRETMIIIYNDGLEFIYQDYEDARRAPRWNLYNSRIVYRIGYNNIRNIEYDERYHMLYITGHAENIEYEDYEKKKLKEKGSYINTKGFDENTRYPIILALGNNCEKAFVANLKQRVGMFY